MKLIVTESHKGQSELPLFKKGAFVEGYCGNPFFPNYAVEIWGCRSEPNWVACKIDGYDTFIPEFYITDNVLIGIIILRN